jgi:type IV secretion system protein VirB1
MLLKAAALTSLIATCAPGVAEKDLLAIAQVESGYDTLAIHDNTTGRTLRPDSQAEAASSARQLLNAEHSVDLGLMQINAKNMTWLGLTIDTAFDPCESIRAAAKHLTQISVYNTGSPTRGFSNGYVGKVLQARATIVEPAGRPPAAPAPQPAPHVWHDDRDRQPEDPAPRGRHEWHEASQSIKQIEAVNEH